MPQHFTDEMRQWRDVNLQKHLCKCGCGNYVEPTRWRWYNGRNLDYLAGHDPQSHSKGEGNGTWNGGRFRRSDGYILVLRPEHPFADSRGYVREHRLVMEEIVGRYLEPSEDVHHINGDRSDNRPENLQLMSGHDHHCLHTKTGEGHFNWVDVDTQKLIELRRSGLEVLEIASQLGISRTTVYRRLHRQGLL